MNLTNLFSIQTGNEKCDDALRKLFYQLDTQLSEIEDELKRNNPNFGRCNRFVDSLNLDAEEDSHILAYFSLNRKLSEEENTTWLREWISKNRYEMPEDFVKRMSDTYRKVVAEAFGDE